MNSALCLLVYGFALAWWSPAVLTRLTRSGVSPRLSVVLWISAIVMAIGAWVVAGVSVMVEVLSTHSVTPVQYCMDMLLAVNHFGWAGHLGVVAGGTAGLALSVLVARRLGLAFRRLWLRSTEHARTAHILGATTSRPGVVVVSADQPTAYCVAGRPHAIVVTTGAVASLTEQELAAVLAHEQAHMAGHHPQLMMALRALAASLPRVPLLRSAVDAVASLVEMSADDRAARQHGRDALLCSLIALAGSPRQAGPALGAADTAVLARAERLAGPNRPGPRWCQQLLLSAVWAVVVCLPVVITMACHS